MEPILPPTFTASPPPENVWARQAQESVHRTTTFLVLLGAVLLGIVVGYYGKGLGTSAPSSGPLGRGVLLKPGPWGEMEYVPMTISAPDEMLPVRTVEATGCHWVFPGATRESLARDFRRLQLSDALQREWLAEGSLQTRPDGVEFEPSAKSLFALSPKVRLQLYQYLFRLSENRPLFAFVPEAHLEDRFQRAGVSRRTLELFRQLSAPSGAYLLFTGFPALFGQLTEFQEKVRFYKALTEQKTCLVRLHVTPQTELRPLTRYWAKGGWKVDVRAMFDSLAHVQGGTWIDIVEVLPPFPASLLYTFPRPDNPLGGAPVRRDCHWTAFNFFRDPPEPRYSDPAYVLDRLTMNYFPITGDPNYGDLVLFSLPDGSIIHSAVFLADTVVYTKNGDTPVHPWMLTTIADLVEQYSFMIAPPEKLTISYFRNKYN